MGVGGVTIAWPWTSSVCQACDCPRGDTIFLLIHADNARKMVRMGYLERTAAADSHKSSEKK